MIEQWYWIELSGFDPDRENFGTKEFLGNLSGEITGVVLLFGDVDFYHLHDGMDQERTLRPVDCSYGAHAQRENPGCRLWTNLELAGLVRSLQARGVLVYCTVFDMYSDPKGFCELHPEICQNYFDGTRGKSVDLTAKLQDGSSYAEFLGEKIAKVLTDYGFDGVHFGDGISARRIPLQIGDYCDETVRKFVGEYLAADEIDLCCKEDTGKLKRRSIGIYERYRTEWTRFCAERWTEAFQNLSKKIAAVGKNYLFNNAWLRDPFESLYRYGCDLKSVDLTAARGIVVCDVNRSILSREDLSGFSVSADEKRYCEHETPAVMLTTAGCRRELKQFSIVPLKDTNEQWDVLRSSPTMLVGKAFRRRACFRFDGEYRRINEGILYCLSDGVTAQEWKINHALERCGTEEPVCPEGLCFLWSQSASEKELSAYVDRRRPSAFKLLHELQIVGLPVWTVSWFDCLKKLDQPLLCLYAEDFCKEELKLLNAHRGPIVCIGERNPLDRCPSCLISGRGIPTFYVFDPSQEGSAAQESREIFVGGRNFTERVRNRERAEGIWINRLNYARIDRGALKRACLHISDYFGFCRVLGKGDCTARALRLGGGRYEVSLDNPDDSYQRAEVCLPGRTIRGVKALYSVYHIPFEKNRFRIKLPNRGDDLVLVETEEEVENSDE